jgi:hemerythrin superfamily protein
MPARRTRSASTKSGSTGDAIAILKADHDKVKKLFKEFERQHEEEATAEMEQIAEQICNELTIHATVEEELFYPAVRDAIEEDDLLDEAEVEHQTAKDLIAQIKSMTASDEKYAAKVCVLGEYINHHVEEEQGEMFPKARKARQLDLKDLGARIATRKAELKTEMGIEDEEADSQSPARGRSGSHRAQSAR